MDKTRLASKRRCFMVKIKSFWFAVGFAILLPAIAIPAAAQGTADIVGRVTDPGGGVVTGASVTARHLATNITRTIGTSSTGDYAFTALPVGEYEVKTESSGFRSETSRVNLATGDRARVDVKLQLGAVNESVVVT